MRLLSLFLSIVWLQPHSVYVQFCAFVNKHVLEPISESPMKQDSVSERKRGQFFLTPSISDSQKLPWPTQTTVSLFTWSKQKWHFWRAGFYPANQSNLKSFWKALIGWKKAGPLKKPLLFWSCIQAKSLLACLHDQNKSDFFGGPAFNWPIREILASLHDQNKSGFLAGRLLSSRSEKFEKFLKSPDWLEKSRPSKKATSVLIM